MKLGKVVVTCAWPYVNYLPHLGTLVQVLSADVAARYYRLKGEEVVMVSGSDEHGTPIEVEAIRQGISPKQLTDKMHAKVVELFKKWGFSFDNYTRTENPVHIKFVQDHQRKVYNNGYIFTQETEMLYCTKCSRFLPDRFVEGKCPYCGYEPARGDQCDSCGRLLEPLLLIEPYCVICKSKPVIKKTKQWYFDLPKFSEKLANYISKNKQLPLNARNFSLNLIKEGLKPRAMTRDVEWGIPAPFPGAEGKTFYVWFENVLGYISATIEYFKKRGEPEKWKEYWFKKDTRTLYFIGKDNIPFHVIIFPALLLASGEDYVLPWNVPATEFLQFKGEKASKSQRIGIWIDEALELFPADYWRYFLMATRPETKDSNFSWEIFIEKVNADLNDTFGNFIHRTLTFIRTQFDGKIPQPITLSQDDQQILKTLREKVKTLAEEIEDCKLQSATNTLISISRIGNQYLNEKEPWNLIKKNKEEAANILYVAAQIVKALSIASAPFMPFTAQEIWKTLNLPGNVYEQNWDETLKPLPTNHEIAKPKPLFRKIEADEKELDEMLEKARERLGKTA
ncbi:MAG: methionine--tRNA ligase [Candidatus Bathyarchaeota archaeon]|nr:methionine--tRNA ligase [Candidatus Bathyarchaeota archaeon A05DMB-5]MDH7557987.1 methionine--tRNA ligase [Candidatus Bathyarchaeota archaeon]